MKKALCAVLALLWIGAAALAGAPKLSGNLFDSAKQALVCLAAGDYEGLAGSLPFSGDAPDASDWKRLAKKFADLIIPWGGENRTGIHILKTYIEGIVVPGV